MNPLVAGVVVLDSEGVSVLEDDGVAVDVKVEVEVVLELELEVELDVELDAELDVELGVELGVTVTCVTNVDWTTTVVVNEPEVEETEDEASDAVVVMVLVTVEATAVGNASELGLETDDTLGNATLFPLRSGVVPEFGQSIPVAFPAIN